ncbi:MULTISPECIES: response regulator transcription factor [unclassified Crossiella]|uniref:response regulator n=1 Tax=unclassified Crossiella TaxID=2620835 RepID=UPI0020005116|nr:MULTISPECIES: response regulator transcription factor [unclassified Crossiella]MCK2242271.1 response regulator transcription factor [Crossiella sp. S99.2]MCK2254698.1 response regulator transcription factor [Crossiella sp. S99.1]
MIRVLLADDQQPVREALRLLLSAEPDIEIVGEAANGAEAVHLTRWRRPDVVLMDIRMPHQDGLSAIEELAGTPARILVLTTFDLDDYLYRALRAGAAGFLLKDNDPELLTSAIRAAHQGHGLIDPKVTGSLVRRFAELSPAPPGPELAALTGRERTVLRALARGLSNAEISAELGVGEGTVKTHVARVLAKLGLRTRVHAVIYAHEHDLG